MASLARRLFKSGSRSRRRVTFVCIASTAPALPKAPKAPTVGAQPPASMQSKSKPLRRERIGSHKERPQGSGQDSPKHWGWGEENKFNDLYPLLPAFSLKGRRLGACVATYASIGLTANWPTIIKSSGAISSSLIRLNRRPAKRRQ
jgi:hypothetical protein